ncbi:MAG: hypothetical protein GY816_00760 [Cytophagales bacterium]|nr:hypothetical protein [Cytophagales bacterium]
MAQYIIPILFLVILTTGWVGVQLIAKKMKTKNHFDDLGGDGCMGCTCGGTGESCVNEK